MATQLELQTERAKRRTERIFGRIPIEVRGVAADRRSFRETTYALAINRHSARIALAAELVPESRISVTILQNKLTCPFRVVSRAGKSLSEAPEWGVECLQPDLNFWGIFFPERSGRRNAS